MNKRKNPLLQQRGHKNEYAGKYFDFGWNVLCRIVIRRGSPALQCRAMPDKGATAHDFGAPASRDAAHSLCK